jgi:hypothetical protein
MKPEEIKKELQAMSINIFNSSEPWTKEHDKKRNSLLIRLFYEANGLRVDKIIRAKLNDGFYVYHQFGFAHRAYKPAKIIEQIGSMTVKQTQPYPVMCDFIEDNNDIALEIAVMEGRNRAGLKGKIKSIQEAQQ